MESRQMVLPFLNGSFLKGLFSLKGVGGYLFQDKSTVWGKTTQTFLVWEEIWDLIRGRWKGKEARHLEIIFVGWVLSQAEQAWGNCFNLNLPNGWTFPGYTSIWILHQGLRHRHILTCFSDFQMQAPLPGHLFTIPSLLSAWSLCSIIWDGISRVFSPRRTSE